MPEANKPTLPFEFIPNDKYVLVRLHGRLPLDATKQFEQDIAKHVKPSPKPIIVECDTLEELPNVWMRGLAVLAQFLKNEGHGIRLIGTRPTIFQMIRSAGLSQALPMTSNTRAAMIELGLLEQRRIDVTFINPFLIATIRVLQIQANVTAKPGQPFKRSPKDRFEGDISGVIGLVSDAFNGAVVISFPEKTFLSIMSNMIGEPCPELTKDIADGAGELTNIIFGQAKVALNDMGHGIKTAIPTVVTGKDHGVQYMTQGPRVALPFESNAGQFTVEICLSE